jgi:hypothetical protein
MKNKIYLFLLFIKDHCLLDWLQLQGFFFYLYNSQHDDIYPVKMNFTYEFYFILAKRSKTMYDV